jgi:hypothetical protein
MIKSNIKPKQILVIDDNESFVKSIAFKSKIPIKWIFEGHEIKRVSEKSAVEIIDSFTDLNKFLVLINISIKLNDVLRQNNKGINLYRVVIGKLSSGNEESVLLYSFLSKKDLGEGNVFIKILPDGKFKRLPLDFETLLNA